MQSLIRHPLWRSFAPLWSKGHSYRMFRFSANLNGAGTPVKMPSLSPTMTEGSIVKWLKNEGDAVQPGDILCDIQTDKAVMSLETDEEGILAKILIKEDAQEIKVGTLIALLVEEGEDWKDVEIPEGVESASSSSQTETVPSKAGTVSHDNQLRVENFGPSVRLLLEKFGLKQEDVPAQGPHGILLKGDVLNYVQTKNLQPKTLETVPPPPASPSPSATPSVPPKTTAKVTQGEGYHDIELTSMRKTIAKRLLQSKSTIAHTYCTLDCSISNMVKLRANLKNEGIKVSMNDLIIKAAAVTLSSCPEVNCVWEKDQLVYKGQVDVSVAVATDAGLITPIVKGADRLGVQDISGVVADLASRARQNALKLDEFQGGTFTISNLGMFNIKEFSAIINPPQCAILAVGGARVELDCDGKPEKRMRATLSYDQLAISDDTAAMFMKSLKEVLESPNLMVLRPPRSSIQSVDHPLSALL